MTTTTTAPRPRAADDPLFPSAAFLPLSKSGSPTAGTGVTWTTIQPGTGKMDDNSDYVDDPEPDLVGALTA